MRVAVDAGRWTMCCPSSMSDASMRIEDLGLVWFGFCDELLELGYLANLFKSKDFVLLVSVDG